MKKKFVYQLLCLLITICFLHNQAHAMLRAARTFGVRKTPWWRATALLTQPRFHQHNYQQHNKTRIPQTLLAASATAMDLSDDDEKDEKELKIASSRKLTAEEQARENEKALYIMYINSGKFTSDNFDFKERDAWLISDILHHMSLSPRFASEIYRATETCIKAHSKKDHPIDPTLFIMLLWRGSREAEKLLTAAAKNPHTKNMVAIALKAEVPNEKHFGDLRDKHATLYRYHDDMITAVAKWKDIVEAARSARD